MSAQVIKFPRSRIFRTKKDRKLLIEFFNKSVERHPERSHWQHFMCARIALAVSKDLSKRRRERARYQA